jgi:hypothetical protein
MSVRVYDEASPVALLPAAFRVKGIAGPGNVGG